jgi:hypothetical protein
VSARTREERALLAVAFRLSRVPVRASDGTFFFRRRLAGLAPLEDRLYDRLRAPHG